MSKQISNITPNIQQFTYEKDFIIIIRHQHDAADGVQ